MVVRSRDEAKKPNRGVQDVYSLVPLLPSTGIMCAYS